MWQIRRSVVSEPYWICADGNEFLTNQKTPKSMKQTNERA